MNWTADPKPIPVMAWRCPYCWKLFEHHQSCIEHMPTCFLNPTNPAGTKAYTSETTHNNTKVILDE